MANNVLVLGGTGFVGRAVCEQLVKRSVSARIIVPTRRLPRGNAVRALPTVDLFEADIHDDAALRRLLGRADAVVQLVGMLHGSEAEFERVHVELPRRLAAACAATGVQRVVHVSALAVAADAPSRYLRSKAAGEAVLKAAPLALSVLRPSVMFGAEDRFMNRFAHLQLLAPLVPLAGADARFQPVWVDEVAAAVVRCLDDKSSIGQTFEIAGPQVYTLSELVRLAGRWSGRERPQLKLPDALGRLQALMLEWLPGEPLLSRDNLDSMKVASVAGEQLPGLAALGITPTALQAVAPFYLGQHYGRARMERWRAVTRRA